MIIEHLHVENHLLNCSRKSTWCIDFGNFSSFSPWPSLLLVHPGMINWSFSAATRRQRSRSRAHLLLLVLLLLLLLHHLQQHHRVLEAAILRYLLWHGVPYHHLCIDNQLDILYIFCLLPLYSACSAQRCMESIPWPLPDKQGQLSRLQEKHFWKQRRQLTYSVLFSFFLMTWPLRDEMISSLENDMTGVWRL